MNDIKTPNKSKELTQEDVEAIIPHRFENLLIDSCIREEDNFSFHLNLNKEDPLGRDLFLTQNSLIYPVLTEVLALASIICEDPTKSDVIPIFATITRFKVTKAFKNACLSGYVTHKSSKQGFFRYEGHISDNQGASASAQLMAYATKKDDLNQESEPAKTYDLGNFEASKLCSPTPYKDPNMSCITSIERINEHEIITSYSYPFSHPLIKGHFPDNPVMMGVMQWMMVEDAIYAHSKEYPSFYPNNCLLAEGVIVNEKNEIICELQGVELCVDKHPDYLFFVYTKAAKRIFFRGLVKPGTRLFCHVTLKRNP